MTSWLTGIVGEAAAPIVSLVLTIILIVIAVLVFLWLARKFIGGRFLLRHNPDLRLQVVDATSVDNRRKLVLVRRDDVEHLIMIGGQNDLVIEAGIGASVATAQAVPTRKSAPQPAPVSPVQANPAKRPAATEKPAAKVDRPAAAQTTPPAPAAPTAAPANQAPLSLEVANTPPPAQSKPVIAPVPAPSPQIAPVPRTGEMPVAPDVEIAAAKDVEPSLHAEMDALINTLTTNNG